jgi:hypothetical protein
VRLVHKPYFLGAIVTRDTAISTNLNQQFGSQNCADSEFLTVSWPFQVHSTCIQLDILGTFEPAAPAQFYIGKIKEKHPKCELDSVPGAAEPWFSHGWQKLGMYGPTLQPKTKNPQHPGFPRGPPPWY